VHFSSSSLPLVTLSQRSQAIALLTIRFALDRWQVALLLSLGASLEPRDKFGQSALHLAVKHRHPAVARALLFHAATTAKGAASAGKVAAASSIGAAGSSDTATAATTSAVGDDTATAASVAVQQDDDGLTPAHACARTLIEVL